MFDFFKSHFMLFRIKCFAVIGPTQPSFNTTASRLFLLHSTLWMNNDTYRYWTITN